MGKAVVRRICFQLPESYGRMALHEHTDLDWYRVELEPGRDVFRFEPRGVQRQPPPVGDRRGGGDAAAARMLAVRRDPNFLLATILWGNVCANVLLALLADSILTGVAAFIFSTVVLTLFGEIFPQAWFSRRAVLGEVISRLKVRPQSPDDDVTDEDFILLWGEQKRVIIGSDILGRLLRGLTRREPARPPDKSEPHSSHA